jgi:hypothetical protein
MGVLHNSKIMFDAASGDYIYSAAADDRVLPEFFDKTMNVLSANPRAAICFSDPATFRETDGPIRRNHLALSGEPRCFTPNELVDLIRKYSFQIAGHTAIMRRDRFMEAGAALLPELKWHCDWFTSWVLAFRYGACYVPEPLATIRITPGSFASVGRKQWRAQIEILTAMLRLLQTRDKDVAGCFKRSAVLSTYGNQILYTALRNRDFHDQLTLLLVRRAIWEQIHGMAASLTPETIKRKFRP